MTKKRKIGAAVLKAVGRMVTAAVIIMLVLFLQSLISLGILPEKYMWIAGILLLLIVVLIAVMQFVKKLRLLSTVLAFLFLIVFSAGHLVLSTSSNVLEKMTGSMISMDYISLYVWKDSSIIAADELKAEKIGILTTLGRANTDAALAELAKKNGSDVETSEYGNANELVQALQENQVSAVLMNSAYRALLDEAEDGSSAADDLKEIWNYAISRTLNISGNTADASNSDSASQTEENAEADTKTEKSASEEKNLTNTPFVIYVSGNDYSGELKSNGRSDVNILIAVNPEEGKILIENTPRDYYVTLAGIGEKDKLTHAGIYGVDESMRTLSELYEIPVQYYVKLNFTGFMDIIDALGGITVTSDVEFAVADWHYVVGENELSGIEALAFARERYSFASGDRQRGKNQQAVIKGVIQKVCSPAILTNYMDLMQAVTGAVETNFSTEDITSLVQFQLDTGKSWDVETVSADGTGGNERSYSLQANAYVMIPDETSLNEAKEKLKAVLE